MSRSHPKILETTLRDGSYVINFQFTAKDTAILATHLEQAGFEWIEIGHGIGLGASDAGLGKAGATDIAYMDAAARALSSAQWGMFCIPGIACIEHVDVAADHGMKFIRIGTNIGDVAQSRPFIERAKRRGLFVCSNFMKSYTADPKEFARTAKKSVEYGTDVVYLVDSAGSMMTCDIDHYIQAVRETCDVKLGFHGHDNLGLSVANAVRAAELGVDIIDTSLQGMGRSSGNTPTELFVAVMHRLGFDLGFDLLRIMDIAETFVRPLLSRKGIDSIDITAGFAQFHTSYMKIIQEFSTQYDIDPRRLIMALCEVDRVNAPRELVAQLAKQLADAANDVSVTRFRLDRYYGSEQLVDSQDK